MQFIKNSGGIAVAEPERELAHEREPENSGLRSVRNSGLALPSPANSARPVDWVSVAFVCGLVAMLFIACYYAVFAPLR